MPSDFEDEEIDEDAAFTGAAGERRLPPAHVPAALLSRSPACPATQQSAIPLAEEDKKLYGHLFEDEEGKGSGSGSDEDVSLLESDDEGGSEGSEDWSKEQEEDELAMFGEVCSAESLPAQLYCRSTAAAVKAWPPPKRDPCPHAPPARCALTQHP